MTLSSRTDPSHTVCAAMMVVSTLVATAAAAQSTRAASHVRSEDPLIAQLIADAPGLSATFRDLVTAIDTTNGIVYVESGRCGRGARACLVLDMQVAGPNRILRVLVTTRRDREGLIGSIGHELHHAWEILQDRRSPRVQRCSFTTSARHRSALIGLRRMARLKRDTGSKTN